MNSPLDILNKILFESGQKLVSSCFDNSFFSSNYHPVRRILLCELKPKFAQRKVTIVSGSVNVPSGCLQVISPSEYKFDKSSWKIVIPSKETQTLTYIFDEENVLHFSEEFIKVLCEELKKKMYL